jgi:hypothetical protein
MAGGNYFMKTLGCLLLSLWVSPTILAKDSYEENFNRFFTTPTERKNLDLMREQGRLFNKSTDNPDATSSGGRPIKQVSPVKFSGIILRADGKSQVWVSGQPLYSSLKQLDTDKNNSSSLRVPIAGKSISLKPGQIIFNGKAKESYYFVTQSSASSQAVVEPKVANSSSISSVASSSVASQAGVNAQIKMQ